MLTLKRLAIYLITFLISLILALSIGNWRKVDNYLVGYSNRTNEDAKILNKDLVFVSVDLNPQAPNGCEAFYQKRKSMVDLMKAIEKQAQSHNGPKGVVLDVTFSNDNTEEESLIEAILFLQFNHVPVYAVYNINASEQSLDVDNVDYDQLESAHLKEIYKVLSDSTYTKIPGNGRYHTNFYYESQMASYEHDFLLHKSSDPKDSVLIESLVSKVVRDLGDSNAMLLESKRRGSIVPYASYKEMESRTYFFFPDSTLSINSFIPHDDNPNTTIDMDQKILIVGDPASDVTYLGDTAIPRPYVVTWAISDLLDENIRLKLPLESTSLIIGQMLFFAFFVALAFALIFKYVKSFQTKPLFIAILSFIAVLILLYIYYRVILTFKAVIPIGQTIVAMIVAALLSWRFAYKFLVTGVVEGAKKYDIFISYSHGPYAKWVEENVYEPLSKYRNSNGDKLNIFFDKKSIGIGEAFTSKYMWAIVDTKLFLSIVTDEYYGKNHCKNELDLAINRKVEKLIKVNMLFFNFKAIPEPYKTFNHVEITEKDPKVVEKIKTSLDELK